jgi:hypothetical protein
LRVGGWWKKAKRKRGGSEEAERDNTVTKFTINSQFTHEFKVADQGLRGRNKISVKHVTVHSH